MSAEPTEVVNTEPPETTVDPADRIAELEQELVQAGRTMIEFKALVRSEAMKMAEQHGLCPVVEQTLAKVGINVAKVRFEVVQQIEQVRTVEVPEDLMTLLTPEQLMAWLSTGRNPPGRRSREMRAITTLNNHTRNVGDPELRQVQERARGRWPDWSANAPEGYVSAFASWDGRVRHFVRVGDADVDLRNNGQFRGIRGTYAACGMRSHEWRVSSNRDSGRACVRCDRDTRHINREEQR